jgi:signal transduction histidine kinase/DNA-binding response OmpR family regulator
VFVRNQAINTKTVSNGKPIIEECVTREEHFNFSHLDDTFTFEVSTMDFGNKGNIFYEYRIRELGEEWNTTLAGTNRIAFNHLPYGTYNLEIRASKNGSVTPISKYYIHISPPWYKSIFAYFLYFAVLIAIVLLSIFLYFRTRQEKFNEAKLQFFINISHEIRSPLTLIISPIEKMLKENHDESTTKLLHTVHRNTNRILGLINQLLDIRKFEKGQINLKYNETDMVGFIDEIISIFDYQTKNRNINFKFEHNMPELQVWIDRNNFDKVLINLITNSFKYTPDGGEITIILNSGIDDKASGILYRYAEIKIIDSGIGIDNDKVRTIFERFYQIDNNITFSSIGSGIGLNLSKMFVELHHGTITASNRNDTQGSCFTIRLPLGNEHLKKEEISSVELRTRTLTPDSIIQPLPPVKKKALRSKTTYKILIVDDEEEIRNFLKEELEETYRIMMCSNGKEALQKIHTQQPDLIITDVMMPEMDGLTLLKKIRTNVNLSHIPVIMLTAKTEQSDKIEGLEKGADVYLTKPFSIDELHVRITNLLESRKILKGKYSGAQDQDDKIKAVSFKSSDELLMEKVMKFINENISNPEMNVEMLAKSVGLSRVQLHRKLKEITGLPTGEFIRNLRLKMAATLLKEKKINITQIGYAVGFTNQTHFSTTFKKIYGVSPTEYIDQI